MFQGNKFSYPTIDRVTHADGTRFYVCPVSGEPLPSVTTILSATADKSGLEAWADVVGEKRALKERTDATNIGSLMHAHLESHIQGIERPRGNNLIRQMTRRMADVVIERAFPDLEEVWGIEIPLYLPSLYAGTADLIGVYKGKPAIMDYKTSKKIKTRKQITDYFSQLAAYILAHNEVWGTDIAHGVIFMVTRDCEFVSFELNPSEVEDAKLDFLQRYELFTSAK